MSKTTKLAFLIKGHSSGTIKETWRN